MGRSWVFEDSSVESEELSRLYRIAPLGEKSPKDLVTVFSNSRSKRSAYVAVHPEHQGEGLGTAIIEELVELSAGYKKIILSANPGTGAFYRGNGFHRMNAAMAIRRNNEQAIADGFISDAD